MRDLEQQPFYGVIKEFEHWIVLFRDRQVTLGSVIIMSKDTAKASLGDVTPSAWGEFGEVCTFVETAIKKAFGADKFNYLALMMYDPEVHFHVIPRYSKPVSFMGVDYIDPDWPHATKRVAMDLDAATLSAIQEKIQASIE